MIINVITVGDSHSRISFENIFLYNKSVNSVSIYTFNKNYNYFISTFNEFISNIKNGNNMILVLCFGEIDARCLIHKQIMEKNRDEDEVIKTLINDYEQTLLKIFESLTLQEKKRIFIMSIVPTSKETDFGHEYNQRGSTQERIRYTEKLNKLLKECSERNNFTFFDIYNLYLDNNTGTIIQELSDGVHITNRELLFQQLINYLFTIFI